MTQYISGRQDNQYYYYDSNYNNNNNENNDNYSYNSYDDYSYSTESNNKKVNTKSYNSKNNVSFAESSKSKKSKSINQMDIDYGCKSIYTNNYECKLSNKSSDKVIDVNNCLGCIINSQCKEFHKISLTQKYHDMCLIYTNNKS